MGKARKTDALKYLNTDQIEQLFAHVPDVRNRAILRLALHLGLRASELGLLQLGDYNGNSGKLQVHRLKGSNSGQYLLPRVAETSLRAWIRERGTAPGPLFPSRQRNPIGRRQLDRLMKKYCAAAGLPGELAHMHALKHSCGSLLAEQGEDILAIQDWLGHRNIQNTMIYLHATNRAREAAGARLRDWGTKKK